MRKHKDFKSVSIISNEAGEAPQASAEEEKGELRLLDSRYRPTLTSHVRFIRTLHRPVFGFLAVIKHNLKSNYSITQVNQLSQEGGKRWNLPEPTKLEHMQKFYLQEAPETGELLQVAGHPQA